jgi:hypothetical protein
MRIGGVFDVAAETQQRGFIEAELTQRLIEPV